MNKAICEKYHYSVCGLRDRLSFSIDLRDGLSVFARTKNANVNVKKKERGILLFFGKILKLLLV